MSADMREVEAAGPMLLTIQVMLRVGKGRTGREEITKLEIPMIAKEGETLEVEHRPGSQGMKGWTQNDFSSAPEIWKAIRIALAGGRTRRRSA